MAKNSLQNKTILVTGASSGLGRSLALKSALLGGTVFAAARDRDKLDTLASEAEEENQASGVIIPIQTDVRDAESICALFGKIDEKSKGLDVVINNAAVGHNSTLQDITTAELENIIATNLLGTIYVTRESIDRMFKQKGGHLIFVSSLAGKLAFSNLSIYSATKFAIEGLVEAIREELHGTGIAITVVRPGIMDTNFFATAGMSEFAETMRHKMQSPDEITDEIMQAITKRPEEVTIGSDRRFMPLLKFLPKSIARRLLPYVT